MYETLTHPEYFDLIAGERDAESREHLFNGSLTSIRGTIDEMGKDLLRENPKPLDIPITVAIRSLNEADALRLSLDAVKLQFGAEQTQLIVVDNESRDASPKVAEEFGARVISISREEYSHPRSLNICMEEAETDLVLVMPGHTVLASRLALEAVKRVFVNPDNKDIAGMYCPPLPSAVASRTERFLAALGNPFLSKEIKVVDKAAMGVMGATNAVFHRGLWEKYGGFDERLGNGGEDLELARQMIEDGYQVMSHPLLSGHHSHGLGPINYARQFLAWGSMAAAKHGSFDRGAIQKRRPDLDFS